MEFMCIPIKIPKDCNVILGSAHFIKTTEDLYEALINSVPTIRFGIGFCEASGPCLVRSEGNDVELQKLASHVALKLGCGHCFVIFLKQAYPINVLGNIRKIPEVCSIYAATANPLEVIVAETEQGRGIIGVIDGFRSQRLETDDDLRARRELLRKLRYKL